MSELNIDWARIMEAFLGPFSALVILVVILGFIGFASWKVFNKIFPIVVKKIEETNDWKTTFENMSDKATVVADKVSKMETAISAMAEAFRDFRVETKQAHVELRDHQEKLEDEIQDLKVELAVMKAKGQD